MVRVYDRVWCGGMTGYGFEIVLGEGKMIAENR